MSHGIIYAVFCTESGKYYVGQSSQALDARWKEHLSLSRGKCEKPFYVAMRKYGESAFVCSILCETFSQEEQNSAEIYFGEFLRAQYPEGYSLKLGNGRGRHCETTKEKIREARKRQGKRNEGHGPRWETGKSSDKLCPCGIVFRGREKSKYCSSKCYGRFEEKRLAFQFSSSGAKARSKRIKDSRTGMVYPSAREASRVLGISWGSFRKRMLKEGLFSYVDEKRELQAV